MAGGGTTDPWELDVEPAELSKRTSQLGQGGRPLPVEAAEGHWCRRASLGSP